MLKKIGDFFKKLRMVSVPEGSMIDKWGQPLLRSNGWDWYDVNQTKEKKEVKK